MKITTFRMLFGDLVKSAARNVNAYQGVYLRKVSLNVATDFVAGIIS